MVDTVTPPATLAELAAAGYNVPDAGELARMASWDTEHNIKNPVLHLTGPVQVRNLEYTDIMEAVYQFALEGLHTGQTAESPTYNSILNRKRGRDSLYLPLPLDLATPLRLYMYNLVRSMADIYTERLVMQMSREQLLVYPPGSRANLHADDINPSAADFGVGSYLIHTKNQLVSILYLNSEVSVKRDWESPERTFTGGQLYLPKQANIIYPEAGRVVVHPSNSDFPHAVLINPTGIRICYVNHWYFSN